jgi:hypothetical protein
LCPCALVAFRPFDYAQGTLFEKKRDLKKQSQFAVQQNWRNFLYERRLWQYTALPGTRKQSQTSLS